MIDRIPGDVFRLPPSTEAPQTLAFRPNRAETLHAYNSAMADFMQRRDQLQTRYDSGEFDGLAGIVSRVNAGETLADDEVTLIRDFNTLANGEIARYSRRNLNADDLIRRVDEQVAEGTPRTPEQEADRVSYQRGLFHEIEGLNHPLLDDIRTQRYSVAVGEGDEKVGLILGARTEGLIRFIGDQIDDILAGRDPGTVASLEQLRRRRDILFTQSSPLLSDDEDLAHVQKQAEAFFLSQNPMFQDTVIRDWMNGENLIEDARILDIPSRRLWYPYPVGCLPFLIPVPLVIPFVEINSAICDNGRPPVIAVFQTEKGSPVPSVEGAIAEQLGIHLMGRNETDIPADTDMEFLTTVEDFRVKNPDKYRTFQERARRNLVRANNEVRGSQSNEPWQDPAPYSDGSRHIYAVCATTPEMFQEAQDYLDRRNDPNPIAQAWNHVRELWEDRPMVHIRRFFPPDVRFY